MAAFTRARVSATAVVLVAVILAVAPAAVHGARGAPTRQLQQLGTCSTFVANCSTCRFVTSGTRTVTVCTMCNDGFLVKNSGRSCCEWRWLRSDL